MQVDAEARAYDALSQHPRIGDLVLATRALLTGFTEVRRAAPHPERLAQLADELRISRDDAATPFGNALDVLGRGPQDSTEGALACALAAHVVAAHPPRNREESDRAALELLWLGAHTPFDATVLLDRALGDGADLLWEAIADRVRRPTRQHFPPADASDPPGADGVTHAVGRGEVLLGAVALSLSRSPVAVTQAAALASEVNDAGLARILTARVSDPLEPIVGEMTPAPRGPLATALLAVTGLLLAAHAVRLFGRLALAYKRPAKVLISEEGGVRVLWRVEILGRTLRERDVLVPHAALLRATREVRYPRLTLYAGLLALAVGSYLGVSSFVDGARAGSASLLASGLAIVALGLALDFALSSLAPGARARCRVLLVPRDGSPLCVGGADLHQVDAVLARLARP